jgi:hypothetical protein
MATIYRVQGAGTAQEFLNQAIRVNQLAQYEVNAIVENANRMIERAEQKAIA